MKKIVLPMCAIAALSGWASNGVFAQGAGNLSGDLMLNANFFSRDSAIGADNELYNNYLSGAESWLTLRYSNYGFTGFIRMDVFNNSNLRNPQAAMSGFGIGAWSISKSIKNLNITGGYIYDQIGSGVIFRAYEDRGLLIDNALQGIRLKYDFSDHLSVKAFTGQQKNIFERYQPIIKGAAVEGDFSVDNKAFFNPGAGVINRTLDAASYNATYSAIGALPVDKQFPPRYNTYAFTLYNTLTAGDFSWYVEGAYKTKEPIQNNITNTLENVDGTILYSTLNYARKGLAVTLSGRRTENFMLRTSASDNALNGGMLNWQPIIAQIRPQRVISRYTPASQDVSEMGGSANVLLSPSEKYDFNVSYTHINTLNDDKLFREVYIESNIRSLKNLLVDVGVQYLEYNQFFYQGKNDMIYALTPFAELTYKVKRNQSLKLQAQYMHTQQDYGSWAYLGLEYAIAPRWSFALSDMYNIKPTDGRKAEHYYNAFVAYTKDAHRFSLAWVKQVEGVNCSGGVCRYEPAFNGLRLMITSSF